MFRIEIRTGGSAFRSEDAPPNKDGEYPLDPNATEIKRILKNISDSLEYGETFGSILDVYGNKVGKWSLE